MFYVVMTVIIGLTTNQQQLPTGYHSEHECMIAAEQRARITIPSTNEAIIFTCVKLEGA